MKYILLFLLFFSGLSASAQDSTQASLPDTVQFELTHYQHVMVYAYLPSKESVDAKRYERFLTDNVPTYQDSTGAIHLVTPNARLKYWPRVNFLEYSFSGIGGQQERLVASDNRRIQQELMNQLLPRRPDVLQVVGSIIAKNAAEHEQVVSEKGVGVLHKLKL